MIKELKLLFAVWLLYIALRVMPESKERIELALFIINYATNRRLFRK